jgi:hypothetical protein
MMLVVVIDIAIVPTTGGCSNDDDSVTVFDGMGDAFMILTSKGNMRFSTYTNFSRSPSNGTGSKSGSSGDVGCR